MEEITMLNEQLKDHNSRIRRLEEANMEMKYNLLSIENGQKDIKLLINELNKNQNDLINKFVDAKLNTDANNNKNIWNLIWKVGAILSPIAVGIFAYFKQ